MATKLARVLSLVLGCVLPAGLASAQDAHLGGARDLGQGSERICRSLKLRAVSDYYGCLLKTSDARSSRCKQRFAWEFAQADRLSPGCGPVRDLDPTQDLVQGQAQAVLVGGASQAPCAQVLVGTDTVTCQLTTPGQGTSVSQIVLGDILAQLASNGVTENTVLWLQAWGGNGGNSHDYTRGGAGGFAQTITSISDLESAGIVNLYFYLGNAGTHSGLSGGQGGTATIVTAQDLTLTPTTNPFDSMIILMAGGGGGSGGDGNGLKGCLGVAPHFGGTGGVAIATTAVDGQGVGPGGAASAGGQGGTQGAGGAGQGGAGSGQDGVGGNGGEDGAGYDDHVPGSPGWANTGTVSLSFTGGKGGSGVSDSAVCTSGGGGGGGGWGGGGGGGRGNETTAAGAGGGGGSSSIRSTQSDGDAPTSMPTNPSSGGGFVQLVFNLDPDPQQ